MVCFVFELFFNFIYSYLLNISSDFKIKKEEEKQKICIFIYAVISEINEMDHGSMICNEKDFVVLSLS